MGHTACQRADGLHLLCLEEFVFQSGPFILGLYMIFDFMFKASYKITQPSCHAVENIG